MGTARLLFEIRLSLRSLCRHPVFAIVFVIIFALSIAGTVSIYTLVDAVLFRPLPYPQDSQLVTIHRYDPRGKVSDFVSASTFVFLQENARSFSAIAAIAGASSGSNLSADKGPVYVRSLSVSQGYFQTLGVRPMLGREFLEEEARSGGPGAIVLSHSLWVTRFGTDPSILGSQVHIGDGSYKIVGVMPASFHSFPSADAWLPLPINRTDSVANKYIVIGRAQPDFTITQVSNELVLLSPQMPRNPRDSSGSAKVLRPESYQDYLVGKSRRGLMALLGAVCMVLLIACTNLTALFMSRTAVYDRELSIRAALGATGNRLIRIVLIDSSVLSIMGAVLGLALASVALPLLSHIVPVELPGLSSLSIDPRVVLLVLVFAAVCALLFGSIPALRARRTDVYSTLKDGHSQSLTKGRRFPMFHVLVSAETAVSIVLLTAAGLLVGSFVRLRSVPLGFDPDHLFVCQLSLNGQRYQTALSTAQLADDVLSKLQSVSGVASAGAISGLPFENGLNIPMYPSGHKEAVINAGEYRQISAGYFKAMGITMKRGRQFQNFDSAESLPVAIVNEAMAQRFWHGSSPVGDHVLVGDGLGQGLADKPREIVGVVADVHETGLDKPASPTLFVPLAQQPDSYATLTNQFFFLSFLLRSSAGDDVMRIMQGAVHDVQPDLPLAVVHPIRDVIDSSIARPRIYSWIVSVFAAFALLLTATNLYGLLSYQISQRTRDIGIRMALGAQRKHVLFSVLRAYVLLVAAGAIVGVVAAIASTRLISTLLYGIGPNDPMTYISVVVMMLVVTSAAAWIPSHSATRVNPVAALRKE
jgi:predicted permease